MRKLSLVVILVISYVTLLPGPTARAQSAFFQAVTNLNPVAYWPLQETAAPPAADVEVNLGSLGAAGNAYYSSTNAVKGFSPGAITGDSDTAVGFQGGLNGSFLAVPLADSRVALPVGPFTVEAWVYPTNASASTVIAQTGASGTGGLNNSANSAGWSLNIGYVPSLAIAMNNTISFHVYNGVGAVGGAEATYTLSTFSLATWYHVVAVFDGVNVTLYVNGAQVGATMTSMTGTQARDTWDPLTIGCGRGLNNNRFGGSLDEVAIYTNVLSADRVAAHYNAGNGGGGYQAAVNADNPYMYWRLDAAVVTAPDLSSYPPAGNFGSATAGGLYLQGTTAGVAGPSLSGMGSPSYGCAINGLGTAATNTVPVGTLTASAGTGVVITNLDPSLNLRSSSSNLSVMLWFKANPADNRFQGLVSHGDSSWRMAMGNGGNAGKVQWNFGAGGDLVSRGVYNDGQWHFVTAVYTNSLVPTNTTGWLATNYLYVDGVLDNSALVTNQAAGTSTTNVLLGGAPDYVQSGNNNQYRPQRFFAGSLAHVAYLTNALSASQVAALYAAAGGVPLPVITGQPVTGRINGAGGNNGSGPNSFIFFGVLANGATGYQWYYNSTSNYSGATQLTDGTKYVGAGTLQVTVSNLVDNDSGYYYVAVTNGYGSVTSILAALKVSNEPLITSQTPAGGTLQLFQNQNYTLSVTVTGETNFTYQWYTNGVADTSAGTASTYPLLSVQTAMSGYTYQCIVTNTIGSATSAPVTLSVQSLPGNISGSTYSSTLLGMAPSGYWPMHEVAAAAPGDVETNLGTLGNLANGYYADWAGRTLGTGIVHQVTGALAGDSDPATGFNDTPNNGSTTYPGFLVVPRTAPATTLKPPFTIEAWAKPYSSGFGDIVSQNGSLNGVNNQNDGVRLSWGSGGGGAATQGFQVFVGNGTARNALPGFPTTYVIGQWYHVVCTFDGQTWLLYVNGGQVQIQPTNATFSLAVDTGSPICVAQGLWGGSGPGRAFPGAVDEVAIYTNVLDPAEIANHYNAGINPTASPSYKQLVLATNPVVYLRMDAPNYTAPAASTWPTMANYGAVGGSGLYSPGTLPGLVAGPNALGLPGTKAMGGTGMGSFADAGFDPAFNPTTNAFSYSAWFKGYPADSRSFQTIVGHSDSSFRAAVNSTGKLQAHAGGGDLTSPAVLNDGNWHHFLITYSGTNANVGNFGTNILYVDGVQVATGLGVGNAGSTQSVMMGNDPQYTNNVVGLGRALAGSVCEVAYWNGVAISSNQEVALWNAAGVPPSLTSQPVAAGVNEGSAFTNTAGVSGSAPLAFRWYYNSGSASYAGATAMTDSLDGRVMGTATLSLVFTNVHGSDAGYYYFVSTNSFGSVTSSIVQLTVFTSPVIGSYSPVTYTNLYTLYVGASPVFKLNSVVGAAPISFQWYTNGVKDVAGTNAIYGLTNVSGSGVTNYCVLSNFVGSITSFVWRAVIVPAPVAPYPQSVLGLNPAAYWRLNEADDGLSDGNPGALAHDYRGGNDGIYTNTSLAQTGYSLGLANQYGDVGLATEPSVTSAQFGIVAAQDSAALSIAGIDFSGPTNTSRAFSISVWVNGAATQISGAGVVTKGYGNGGEQFDLDVYTGAFRFFVRDAGGGVHGPTTAIHTDNNWHHLVGVCDEPNSVVSLYVDGALAGQSPIASNAGLLTSSNLMSIGSRRSSLSTNDYDFNLQGLINDVAIYNYALTAAQVASNCSAAGVAPVISQQPPAAVSVPEGGTLIVQAAAIGSPLLHYQWQDTLSSPLMATQTNATLTISNAPTDLNGDTLTLNVTNIYGSAVSSPVMITVQSGPPILTASNLPPVVLLPEGKSYAYSVQASGTLPLSYQWYLGATPIPGQTTAAFTVFGNAIGSTNVSVLITNIHGSINPSSLLTVIAPPTDPYSAAVLGLHPVGYWPLQESNSPAPVTLETNLGKLGRLGDAYYAVPAGGSSRITLQAGGALSGVGDNDPAVTFGGTGGFLGTNYLFVPEVSPVLAFRPPLSFEAWVYSSDNHFSDIMGQAGAGLNTGAGAGIYAGIRMSYGGNNGPGQPNLQAYSYSSAGVNVFSSISTPPGSMAYGAWHHCVMTLDPSFKCTLYLDGFEQGSGTLPFLTNTWTPLTIADSRWLGDAGSVGPTRSFAGSLDEVAVYTNLLTPLQVTNHYQAGTNSGNYVATVLADNPLLYYRMDALEFVTPTPGQYPQAVNYGSAPVNGAYPGGVQPGAVAGPSILGLGESVAAPINGVISCVDGGNDATFNPTNHQPFSAMLCFKGYPADGRVQTLMSHGTTNWAMNLDGSTGRVVWNLFNGGQVTSTNILNDGNWHMVVGVDDGTTSTLYVDGAFNQSGAVASGLASEPGAELFLGGNPDFTSLGSTSSQRYFAGAIAQAALFTNALSAVQVQQLFDLATVPTISVVRSGGNVTITYTGTLLSATTVTGAYTAVGGASSPYTVPATGQAYYRAVGPSGL